MDKFEKDNTILLELIGYLAFLNLMLGTKLMLTDSRGIQEEASILKILTRILRDYTERPVTI